MIHLNYKDVHDLVNGIGLLCLTMLQEARQMENELHTLEKTCSDDAMEEISRCLGEFLGAIDGYQNDMISLANLLRDYANAMEATK